MVEEVESHITSVRPPATANPAQGIRARPCREQAPATATETVRMARLKLALAHRPFAFRKAAKPNPMRSTMAINWARVKRKRLMGTPQDRGTNREVRDAGLTCCSFSTYAPSPGNSLLWITVYTS